MTTNSLLSVTVTALLFTAACKSDFQAGSYNDGGVKDASSDGGADRVPDLPIDVPTACRAPSPNYGPTSSFERLPNGTPAAAQTCPAACGDSAWPSSGPPNIDIALPYGTCTPGTADCSALAGVPCACGSTTGPVDGFNCSCEGGTWICRIQSQGTALCAACSDAGVGDGLNLAGLTALTVTSDPLTYGTYPPIGCFPTGSTSPKDVFSLDLQTRVLNWNYCAFDFNTRTRYYDQAARELTDLELTAVRLMLDRLSTNYDRSSCGIDKEIETLDLTFGDRRRYSRRWQSSLPSQASSKQCSRAAQVGFAKTSPFAQPTLPFPSCYTSVSPGPVARNIVSEREGCNG